MLTGQNGILNQAGNAKEQTEIEREKEIIALSVTGAKTKEDYSNIKKSELQKQLNSNAGEGKTELYDDGDVWIIYFIDTQRVYSVDNDNNIRETSLEILVKDESPGQLDGSGSSSDPFVIMSIEDLCYFSQQVNNGNNFYSDKGGYVVLGRSLNFKSELSYCSLEKTYSYDEITESYILDETSNSTLMDLLTTEIGFIPIGDAENPFSGHFDGKDYEIKNLFENTDKYAGFFGYLDGGYSRGTIVNLTVYGNITTTSGFAGGICAYSGPLAASIKNCKNYANVSSKYTAGGILGHTRSSPMAIENCENYGKIEVREHHMYSWSQAEGCAGGINGWGVSSVLSCASYGDVSGYDSGGIIGGSGDAVVQNCVVGGSVNGSRFAGGVFGTTYLGQIYIYNCSVDERCVITSEGSASGIFCATTHGRATVHIYNSYVLGEVDSVYVGGISYSWSTIKNTYFAGTVNGTYVGGMSYQKSTYENCYYINTISSGVYNVDDSELVGVQTLSEEKMKQKISEEGLTFLELLNSYVDEYNSNEENTNKLLNWKCDTEIGFPMLNF